MRKKYKWTREVFGRQQGQVEEMETDPDSGDYDPMFGTWLAAGLIVSGSGGSHADETRGVAERTEGDDSEAGVSGLISLDG